MPQFTTLISGLSFTECPRWRDGRFYISDFYTQRVLAVAMDGTAETVAHVPQQPSGLGFLPDGRMLIVSVRDRKVLRREVDSSLVEHADLSGLAPWHLNDMLVNHDGQAWVGNFGFDLMGGAQARSTVLIGIEPDGTAKVESGRTSARTTARSLSFSATPSQPIGSTAATTKSSARRSARIGRSLRKPG